VRYAQSLAGKVAERQGCRKRDRHAHVNGFSLKP
jgi:hypothetical protein